MSIDITSLKPQWIFYETQQVLEETDSAKREHVYLSTLTTTFYPPAATRTKQNQKDGDAFSLFVFGFCRASLLDGRSCHFGLREQGGAASLSASLRRAGTRRVCGSRGPSEAPRNPGRGPREALPPTSSFRGRNLHILHRRVFLPPATLG